MLHFFNRKIGHCHCTGSIYRPTYRKPDGTVVEQAVWWVEYYRNGVPIRESAKTDDWEEANRFLKRRNGEVVTGRFTGTGPECQNANSV